MGQEIDYFFAALDFHLKYGKTPKAALESTVEDYAAVFHSDDERPSIAKAIERALLVEGK